MIASRNFASHIVDDGFAGHPAITINRMMEEDDVLRRKDPSVGQLTHGDEMSASAAGRNSWPSLSF
jgi:hypothetical protein